jgi:hypothetical protein
MFVVRTDPADGGEPSYKAFRRLTAARQSLHTLGALVRHGEALGVFLFEVPHESDPWRAIEAVRAGSGVLLERDPWGDGDRPRPRNPRGPGENPDA